MQLNLQKLRALERRHAQLEASMSLAAAEAAEQRRNVDLLRRRFESYFSAGAPCPKEIAEVWHELRFDPEAALRAAKKYDSPGLAAIAEELIEAQATLAQLQDEARRERARFEASAIPLARLHEFARQHDGKIHTGGTAA
ncbi:hypothetical protein [Methylococcus capsulatus]|uniref:hypothetical protein n=1 Tax=Methylococcus capsulatus TaxID=414 RepID=UPI001C52D973|nr:hypothetical protein [Methylococcus capsulatus]QXP90014.1 hypothetical protein KW114_13265 [Methylococcus capsulatus]